MAVENKLSDKALKALLGKARDKQKTISDGKGLSVRVSKHGAISFVYFFRTGGRCTAPVWMTLGRYPDMSLKMAREKRDLCRSWLVDGRDPRIQIKLAIEKTMRPVTVKDALMYWVDNYAKDHRVPECRHLQRFEKHIFPVIGHIPVAECLTEEWIACFDKFKNKSPVVAGHTFADAKQALRFCRMRKYAISNALDDLKKNDMGSSPQKRDKVLTDEQLKTVWSHLWIKEHWQQASIYIRRLMVLCLVFGCRQKEVRASTWKEWDLVNWIWTVPKENSKNGMDIVRPIPEGLRGWIAELHEATKHHDYILTRYSSQNTVSAYINKICIRFGHGEDPWTIHDFRRVLATKLNDMGVDAYVVEQLLGHSTPGVMGIYNRSKYIQKKLEALNIWFDYLNCLSGAYSNVSVLVKKVI